jgi:hypothetical protein
MSTSPVTCTVVVAAPMVPCGKPVVSTFTARNGAVYGECAEHCANVHEAAGHTAAHPATRTTKPFVLVAGGRIVGYAESTGPAVQKRAARLGAKIVPVTR